MMEKDKDMMNPMNWGIDEIKEATTLILITVPFLIVLYIALCIFY